MDGSPKCHASDMRSRLKPSSVSFPLCVFLSSCSRTVKCCDATDCDNDYDIIPPGSDQPEETATVRVEVIHGGL